MPKSQEIHSQNSEILKGDAESKESSDSEDEFGPTLPIEKEDEDNEELDSLPISHSTSLSGHSKAVTAITLDPSGGRLISGGRDHNMYIWDFHNMDQRKRHWKRFEPVEGNPVLF